MFSLGKALEDVCLGLGTCHIGEQCFPIQKQTISGCQSSRSPALLCSQAARSRLHYMPHNKQSGTVKACSAALHALHQTTKGCQSSRFTTSLCAQAARVRLHYMSRNSTVLNTHLTGILQASACLVHTMDGLACFNLGCELVVHLSNKHTSKWARPQEKDSTYKASSKS
eukprot:scaffold150453_cov20-Tisochrysis_lutea.AAC.2